MEGPRYIAVEGPIGVGKTSLAKKLAEGLGAKLVLEDVEANPFLPQFYQDRKKYALQTQVLFLVNRYLQQKELAQADLFNQRMVCDYLFSKDRIFASINLSKEELFLYEKIYSLLDTSLPKPDLVIFLQASHNVLIKNIRKRGVVYEKGVEEDYLEELSEAYNRYFFTFTEIPVVVLNVTDLDFVKSKADYDNLVREILSPKHRGQKRYVSIK